MAFLALACVLHGWAPTSAFAQGKRSDSVVKVSAKADKPGADGKQVVTITVAIDKSWYIYANPVGLEDFAETQTTVTVAAKVKPTDVKIEYPAGKVVKDKVVGDYKIYEDKAVIKATVQRAKDDTSPLEVSVKVSACSMKTKICLLPATIKVKVP
jgi:hypothetical protein